MSAYFLNQVRLYFEGNMLFRGSFQIVINNCIWSNTKTHYIYKVNSLNTNII